jgi:hypothetical protein
VYLIYLDESGTDHENDTDTNYTLGGLVIYEKDWRLIDNGVKNIKKQYRWNESHEFHMRRFYNRNKSAISRNNNCIPALIINSIYDLIARSPLILFCMSVNKLRKISKNVDVELEAWEALLNRLNICVDKLCRKYSNDEFGLLIMDEKNHDKDLKVRNFIYEFRESGTQYQILNRIIEDPLFTPSDWRNLTQMADAVICCVKFRNEPFFKIQFEKIQHKFDKDKNGNAYNYGLKFW